MNTKTTFNSSLVDLGKYIKTPSEATACQWELVTLPEQSGSDLPGPTDYVVLIAVIKMTKAFDVTYPQLKLMQNPMPIQSAFVRPWLSGGASNVLLGINKENILAYEFGPLTNAPSKVSMALPFDGGVVVYVEYLSPE
mgnify:FL=1